MVKATKAQIIERIQAVKALLLDNASRGDILDLCATKFGVGESQTNEYTGRAREEIAAETEAVSLASIEWHILQRMNLYRRLNGSDQLRDALAVLKDLAELQGLYKRENKGDDDIEAALMGVVARFTPPSAE